MSAHRGYISGSDSNEAGTISGSGSSSNDVDKKLRVAAANYRQDEVIRLIDEEKADLNSSSEYGNRAIHLAVRDNVKGFGKPEFRTDTAYELMKRGANLKQKNSANKTPAKIAGEKSPEHKKAFNSAKKKAKNHLVRKIKRKVLRHSHGFKLAENVDQRAEIVGAIMQPFKDAGYFTKRDVDKMATYCERKYEESQQNEKSASFSSGESSPSMLF